VSAASQLKAIAAARPAGFSLEEIRCLLDSRAEGTVEWREKAESTIAEVRTRIEQLQSIEAILRESLECGCGAWDECPII
jgi:DNA-binding transcriptional MerR regulator